MWIVQLALRRPYTFVIMAMLIVILGGLAVVRMPTDFPDIDIPVVSVIWTHAGVSPEEMAEIITVRSERALYQQIDHCPPIARRAPSTGPRSMQAISIACALSAKSTTGISALV